GNVDTRLRKLGEGLFDAIVLARAGLQRLGRESEASAVLDVQRFVPAPGQGSLALQARAGDVATRGALAAVGDGGALACLLAERSLARALDASCNTPLGAYGVMAEGKLHLRAWVGLPDGSAWIEDELSGDGGDPEVLGIAVGKRLLAAGAAEMLRRAERMAV
ncbi:MAG TPA: hypothetical protein VGF47_04090, partial [Solirubrobacteraceae bacterium]